jgi:hypothetical protein
MFINISLQIFSESWTKQGNILRDNDTIFVQKIGDMESLYCVKDPRKNIMHVIGFSLY